MANKTTRAEYIKDIFIKLHRYQMHGADNLILLLTRYLRGKADYMASYIELVAERTGVSSTGRITTTNADIMKHVVRAMLEIQEGITPLQKDIDKGWSLFMAEFHDNKIKL